MRRPSKIGQYLLEKKYKKAKEIYIVCCWARWTVLPAKLYKIDKKTRVPKIIQWTDHNGTSSEYYVTTYYWATTGRIFGWYENEQEAKARAKYLNEVEGL